MIVGREDYFTAAIDILAEADHGGLKMSALCQRLDVTTGSFYNYFGSWARFKTELLGYWLEDRTVYLAEAARQQTDPELALAALIDFACELPHRGEAAIRAWSHSDAEVRQIQTTVDEQRYRVTFDIMLRGLGDRAAAETFARLGIFILNGYQQTQPLPDPEHLRQALQLVAIELVAPRRPGGAHPDRVVDASPSGS